MSSPVSVAQVNPNVTTTIKIYFSCGFHCSSLVSALSAVLKYLMISS